MTPGQMATPTESSVGTYDGFKTDTGWTGLQFVPKETLAFVVAVKAAWLVLMVPRLGIRWSPIHKWYVVTGEDDG